MVLRLLLTMGIVHLSVAVAQLTAGRDSPFQILYAANLNVGDSQIYLSNTGASGAGLAAGTSASVTGAICVNIYAFSPEEEMVTCCSCPVTPNGLVTISVRRDLISNTLTPAVPSSLVIKLIATRPIAGSCSSYAMTRGERVPGLAAWGTTIKEIAGQYQITENPALPATLSAGELTRSEALCAFIHANGSGFGICKACRMPY
jgi:hypothetical protein